MNETVKKYLVGASIAAIVVCGGVYFTQYAASGDIAPVNEEVKPDAHQKEGELHSTTTGDRDIANTNSVNTGTRG